MAVLTFRDEICELYQGLLSGFPQGIAVVTREPSTDPAGGEDIVIRPANPNSAEICLHPMGDILYTAVGRHTSMELWVSSRKQEEQELKTLRDISLAVIDGKFSEDVWTVNDKVVKSQGIFEIGGRMQKMGIGVYLGFFNPFCRKRRRHFDYSPYVQGRSDIRAEYTS
jgi:hypothetical protein